VRFGIVTTAFCVLRLGLGLLAVLAMALGAVAWRARAQ
jgi:hypothetical protein